MAATAVHGLLSACTVPAHVDVLLHSRVFSMLGYAELVSALPVLLGEYAAIWLCLRVVLSAQQHVRQDEVLARWHTLLLQVRLRCCLAHPPCALLRWPCARVIASPPLEAHLPRSRLYLVTLQQRLTQAALALYPVQALVHFQLALRTSGVGSSTRETRAKAY